MKINLFWFRRDLRIEDNTALEKALGSGLPVLPLFIFDTNIIGELPADDSRISFIHECLSSIDKSLRESGSSLYVTKGDPVEKWKELISRFDIAAVYINKDYEPYAIDRDIAVEAILKNQSIPLLRFKDQVIFEENEVVKADGSPYTVFTPYRNQWMKKLELVRPDLSGTVPAGTSQYFKCNYTFLRLEDIGFRQGRLKVRPFDLHPIPDYHKFRDNPAADMTTHLSPHLRFGTLSIRKLVRTGLEQNMIFLNELIWREFFMQILFHFPNVVTGNFKPAYDDILWRNDENEFQRWCSGETGYPIVDGGMRQLNSTGWMHNRVRMITSGFLCKHLLIDWRWGEAYFARQLLDYELSSNNGNWQWAAGTGCDAAPYFRIFNPETQQKKFDPKEVYIRRWAKDYGKPGYPAKMIVHEFARQRALEAYKTGMKRKLK
ncbi:MAG: deoxyribodipyrimidine photo-lyase [Bacteroidales bacterium]|nr:deoxyribodipyrimidine photo-lyase [Bacteroidales bacterium]